jgi:hypothetical protein
MTTKTRKTTLMGATEVAEYLHVSRQRVLELRQKHADFPAPLEQLKAGPVWDKAEIERFLENWDRTPGRPRKRPLPVSPDTVHDQTTATPSNQEEVASLEEGDTAVVEPQEPAQEPEATPVEEQQPEPLPEPEIPAQPTGDPESEPYQFHEPVDSSGETLHYDN